MDEYKAYQFKGKTMLIKKYLIIGETSCKPENYNIFDIKINSYVEERIKEVEKNGYTNYNVFSDLNREMFNTFKYYDNAKNKKIFLYTEVYSKTKTKIIINITCSQNGKLWVNGKCLFINPYFWGHTCYLTVYLNRGKNTFLIEQYSPEENHILNIQLLNYKFEMSDDIKALSNCKTLLQINPLTLINESCYQPHNSKFKFMYFSGLTDYKPEYRIELYDGKAGFVKKRIAKLNEIVEINLDELRSLNDDTLRYEWIGCYFEDKDNHEIVNGFYIYINDFTEKRNQISKKLCKYEKELDDEITANIQGIMTRQKVSGDFCNLFWSTLHNRDLVTQLETGKYPYGFYKNFGINEFFIHSKLDNTYIRMTSRIPQNFDQNKAYPVMLALSTGNDGNFAWQIPENDLSESVLCFDVTGRGFTGGSYVAEASIFEILEWIKCNYKIDEDRIYILGQSNGGYATWAISQNYPQLPAAIFPHIGYLNIKNVENTSNIPTYQLVSPMDHVFAGRENVVKNKLKPYGNFHQYNFKEMIHHHFIPYFVHPFILNEMLKSSRNLYPKEILYRTERNRHLESYWIKLHGISKGEKFAKIKADIKSDNFIKIIIKNANGFTITIPPHINRKKFSVVINSKYFIFENYNKQKLVFEKDKIWSVIDKEPLVDYRKGTGLLDIYLNSMRIIIPKSKSEIVKKTAKNFAKPYTNGFDTIVYTDYPVYSDEDVPNHILAHNLILIDVNESNEYVKRFKDKLKVKCCNKGYEYKKIRTDGDYVVMQVIANPYNAKLSILVISTNNEDLLGKHILLRKVIIPTYSNGIHAYWNNEILIYTNGKYYASYENEDELRPIEKCKNIGL